MIFFNIPTYNYKMRLLLSRYSKNAKKATSSLSREQEERNFSPVAISELDLYLKFSTNPQIGGFFNNTTIPHSPTCTSPKTKNEICGGFFESRHSPPGYFTTETPISLQLSSPFQELEDANCMENSKHIGYSKNFTSNDNKPIDQERDKQPEFYSSPVIENTELQLNQSVVATFFNWLKRNTTRTTNYERIIPIFQYECQGDAEVQQLDEVQCKANFNTDVSVLMYNEQDPLVFSKLRRRRSLKYKEILNKSVNSNINKISKSILKSKINFHEEEEKTKALENDALDVQDFIYELETREKSRHQDSIQYPSFRQSQLDRYGRMNSFV